VWARKKAVKRKSSGINANITSIEKQTRDFFPLSFYFVFKKIF
jgi:hypothetical protein